MGEEPLKEDCERWNEIREYLPQRREVHWHSGLMPDVAKRLREGVVWLAFSTTEPFLFAYFLIPLSPCLFLSFPSLNVESRTRSVESQPFTFLLLSSLSSVWFTKCPELGELKQPLNHCDSQSLYPKLASYLPSPAALGKI